VSGLQDEPEPTETENVKIQNITQNIVINDSVITGVVGKVNTEEE